MLTEQQEQQLLINWANYQKWGKLLIAIPNGGYRHITTALALKRTGTRKGVPDLFLAMPNKNWHGLWIELKRKKGGSLSSEQKEYIALLSEQNYKVEVCKGFDEAKEVITQYLDNTAL
jgi:hypothetical protein